MTARRTALIVGISGQDGSYLARHLLQNGYVVHGASRDVGAANLAGLESLGVRDRVTLHSAVLTDTKDALHLIEKIQPDEIYNLSGQSSVGLSFAQPVETYRSIVDSTVNLLEAIRQIGAPIRFYNAASSECFGDTGDRAADESTPFRPKSPYGVAKAASFWAVANYREAYAMHACSGILFNHESPLRPPQFVTRKIAAAAARIAAGATVPVTLGNMAIRRDWGWSPDYVEAMHAMMRKDVPADYVIATGRDYSLQEFVEAAFATVGLDWRDHVRVDEALFRPSDIMRSRGDAGRAARELGWRANVTMPEVARRMVAGEHALIGDRKPAEAVRP